MHSINEYLPIGESDLDNALAWDKIPEVNFRRPEGEFKYTDSTIQSLRQLSEQRQGKEKEFVYLERNISWFREKREQKNVSLNLSNRLKEKFVDMNKSQALTDEFESLKSLSFSLARTRFAGGERPKEKIISSTGYTPRRC